MRNKYINVTYSGDLFIFGHSIRDEDDHVFNLVNENRSIKKIFISLYGDQNSDANQKIIRKIQHWRNEYKFKEREYIFYDSQSARIWSKS